MDDIKYFQFEPGSFITGINFQIMTIRQRGVYLSLVLYLYENGGTLPNSVRTLFKLCSTDEETFLEDWEVVKDSFIVDNDKISHPKVTKSIKKAVEFREKKRLAGKKSGLARKNKTSTHLEHTSNTPQTHPQLSKVKLSKVINTTTTGGERYQEICEYWNTFAKKKASPDDINTEQQVISTVGVNDDDVFAKSSLKEFMGAVENYKQAVSLPDSQAWHFNLHKFALEGYKKFLPGIFDIDNYDKSKFEKKSKETDKKKKSETAERILKNVGSN